jgi:hypothetical protein
LALESPLDTPIFPGPYSDEPNRLLRFSCLFPHGAPPRRRSSPGSGESELRDRPSRSFAFRWGLSSPHEGALVVQTEAEGCPEAAHCAKLTSKESGPGYGALLEVVRADVYRGRRIRLRATIRKTEGTGKALLYLQVNRPGSHSGTQTGQAAETAWRTDSLYIEVPKDAESIQFGLAVSGPSESWIDKVAVDIVGDAGSGNEPPRGLTAREAANLAAFARGLRSTTSTRTRFTIGRLTSTLPSAPPLKTRTSSDFSQRFAG